MTNKKAERNKADKVAAPPPAQQQDAKPAAPIKRRWGPFSWTIERQQPAQPDAKKPGGAGEQARVASAAMDEPPTAPPAKPMTLKERLLPEGGLLPWWVGLIFSIYALLKLGMALEHSCGILGIWSPVTKSQLSRAYRQLSVCTHPDKLVGHTAEDIRRGELLFKRASEAREEMISLLRKHAAVEDQALAAGLPVPPEVGNTCSTQLDEAIYYGIKYVFGSFVEVGPYAIGKGICEFVYSVVTFQYEVSMTISFLLLGLTLLGTLRQLLSFFITSGPVTLVVSSLVTVVIGPLPTIWRFVAAPPLRVLAFIRYDLLPTLARADADADAPPADAADGDDEPAAADAATDGTTALPPAAPASSQGPPSPRKEVREMPARGIRQRGRPETKEQLEANKEALLRGEQPGAQAKPGAQPILVPYLQVGSMSLMEVLKRKPPPEARPAAAAALQFDLLLSSTKYVIPLVALVATGQVFNGLWSSMATAQILHKVPNMRPELHHVLLICAGALHTILCAGKSELAEMEENDYLQLQWSWSIRDVLTVANVMSLGATFSSSAGSGNEPPFCASFAAGVALRMLFYDLLPTAGALGAAKLREAAHIELVGVDEVAVRAGSGVGSCAGGIVRASLGWLEWPALLPLAAVLAKAALLLLPALAAAQWMLRCLLLVRRLRRERGREKPRRLGASKELLVPVLRRRLVLSAAVATSLTLLVAHFAAFELNAVNSSLGSFLIVALAGCLFESLLSTYDVRGRLRSAVFFLMFMVL